MDKASKLVIKARDVHWRMREIAPSITDVEYSMINDLLDCILKFPIVKPHEDTKGKETSTD